MEVPTGLCNAPATFRTLTNSISYDHLDEFGFAYIDHVSALNTNRQDHLKHLDKDISRLQEQNLFGSRSKCQSMTEEIDILVLSVSQDGVHTDLSGVQPVSYWTRARKIGEERSFIEILQNLLRFIKNFSKWRLPLQTQPRKHSAYTSGTNNAAF